MTDPAPFFQPGHTYTREHHGDTIHFLVQHVSTSPDGTSRAAHGWRTRSWDPGWEPTDSDDLTGWTDATPAVSAGVAPATVRECAASISGHCLAEGQSETACDTDAGECVHGGKPATDPPGARFGPAEGVHGQDPYYATTDQAVLAVLPAPADRATVLDEAADDLAEFIALHGPTSRTVAGWRGALGFLRRMAAEARGAQQDEAHACGNCEGIDPDSCLTNPACGNCEGIDPDSCLTNPRRQQNPGALARIRRLHDQLAEETDLHSPDDEITRGAAARKIAEALDGWTDPAELRRMAAESAPADTGHDGGEDEATAAELAHALDNSTPYPIELDRQLCDFMAARLLEMLAIHKRPEHAVWQPEGEPEPGEQPQPEDPATLAADRLRCPHCSEDITDYAEDDHVFRTGDDRPYCSGECVIAAHRAGLPTAAGQPAAAQQPPKEARP